MRLPGGVGELPVELGMVVEIDPQPAQALVLQTDDVGAGAMQLGGDRTGWASWVSSVATASLPAAGPRAASCQDTACR
ncbi:MAG: hypothetical protein QM650_05625 [Microlunatus sp.]